MTPDPQFAGLLIHTAYVYRRRTLANGEQKTDRFGQPTQDEQVHHRLATRCTAASGGRQFGERMQDVVQVNHKLFLEPDADIREDDVVTVIGVPITEAPAASDAAGIAAIVAGPRKIVEDAVVDLVAPRDDGVGAHHIEVKINSQRAAR